MKIPHPKLPKFIGETNHPTRRWVIITIITLLLASIITLGVFSYLNWRDLSNHSNQAPTILRSMIEESLGNKDSTEVASNQITTIIKNFDSLYGVNPCISPVQFQWQTIIPAVKEIQESCNKEFLNSLTVIQKLKDILAFITLEKTSTSSIRTAIDTTANSGDYAVSAKVWSDLATSVLSKTDTNFQPVTDKIKNVATDIAAAYTTLSSALTAKNKSSLDAAVVNLQKKYDALTTINSVAITERTVRIDLLTKQYQSL